VRLYLDNSVLNRPYDDQRQPRVWLETLCFVLILQMAEQGEAELVSSIFHFLENDESPIMENKNWVEACLNLASPPTHLTEAAQRRTSALVKTGVRLLDASHLASAEAAAADFFVTCDDKLIKRYRGPIRALTPAELILILTQEKT
jgi:hypothetical protein